MAARDSGCDVTFNSNNYILQVLEWKGSLRVVFHYFIRVAYLEDPPQILHGDLLRLHVMAPPTALQCNSITLAGHGYANG